MIVIKDKKSEYEFINNLNKNLPKTFLSEYINEFIKNSKNKNVPNTYKYLIGLPQSRKEGSTKKIDDETLEKYQSLLIGIHKKWKETYLKNSNLLIEKCSIEEANMFKAITKFFENKILPLTLKELEYTYKTKIPYMYEREKKYVTLHEYSPIFAYNFYTKGLDTFININTNNLFNFKLGENKEEVVVYLNPKIKNIPDIITKIIDYSNHNKISLDIKYQNFSHTMKKSDFLDAISRTDKLQIILSSEYLLHFITFLKTLDSKTKCLETAGKLPNIVEVVENKIGISQALTTYQKEQANNFFLHRTYFLQEIIAHTVRDLLILLEDFNKTVVEGEYNYSRKFLQIESSISGELNLINEKTDKRKVMKFVQKELLNNKYMFEDINGLFNSFNEIVPNMLKKENFKAHIISAMLNVAVKIFQDTDKGTILEIMQKNADKMCKHFAISRETYAMEETQPELFKIASSLCVDNVDNQIDKRVKTNYAKLYMFDDFHYFPAIDANKNVGIYIAGYIMLPSLGNIRRALLCISRNKVEEIKSITKLVYDVYPLSFILENRAEKEEILRLLATFAYDKSFSRYLRKSYGYLGKIAIKNKKGVNAFAAFKGMDFKDIKLWKAAKENYKKCKDTGNLLTTTGARCFYDINAKSDIKKYIFMKTITENDDVDIVQVFCTLGEKIDVKTGANIISYMLEQPEIYVRQNEQKSDYMGEIFRDEEGFKIARDENLCRRIEKLLYKRIIQKFPENEMNFYLSGEVFIQNNTKKEKS